MLSKIVDKLRRLFTRSSGSPMDATDLGRRKFLEKVGKAALMFLMGYEVGRMFPGGEKPNQPCKIDEKTLRNLSIEELKRLEDERARQEYAELLEKFVQAVGESARIQNQDFEQWHKKYGVRKFELPEYWYWLGTNGYWQDSFVNHGKKTCREISKEEAKRRGLCKDVCPTFVECEWKGGPPKEKWDECWRRYFEGLREYCRIKKKDPRKWCEMVGVPRRLYGKYI